MTSVVQDKSDFIKLVVQSNSHFIAVINARYRQPFYFGMFSVTEMHLYHVYYLIIACWNVSLFGMRHLLIQNQCFNKIYCICRHHVLDFARPQQTQYNDPVLVQCCTRCWPNVDPVQDDCAVFAGKAYIIIHQPYISGGYMLIQLRMLIFHVHLFVKQIFTTMFYNLGHAVCTLLRISNESAPSVDYYVDIYMNMSVIYIYVLI